MFGIYGDTLHVKRYALHITHLYMFRVHITLNMLHVTGHA